MRNVIDIIFAFSLISKGSSHFPNMIAPTGPTGPTGLTGPTGPSGETGTAATLAVGNVTTGAPGTQAAVTNVGSPQNAILDFTIPQGTDGTPATSSSLWATNPSVTLNAKQALPLTISYNSPNSGITVNGTIVTLPAGTYLVSYTVNSESGGTGSGSTAITTLAAQANGATIPTSQSLALQERGDIMPLSSTFLLRATDPTSLQLVNDTTNTYPTNYTNLNLTVVKLS